MSKFIWFSKEKEIPEHKKERPKPPLRGRRGAYKCYLLVQNFKKIFLQKE